MMVHEQERVVFMREVAHSLPRRDDSGGLGSKSEPVRLEDRRIPTAHSTTQQQQQQPTENPISPPPMMCIRSGRL
jgi:hypothetical protein